MEMVTVYNNAFKNLEHYYILLFCLSATFFTCLYLAHFDTVAYGLSESNATSYTPIKHIIVLSQGKRSFDNYFGTFPGANGIKPDTQIPINPFPDHITQFTVSVWFNTNISTPKIGFLINKGGIGLDTPGKNLNYGIWMNSKGNIFAGFETKNGTDYQVSSNSTFNDGNWHNAIVAYDGNLQLSLFVDGALVDEASTTGAIPDTGGIQFPIRIGANSLKPDNYFTGYIDNVRIWNRTLENTEILKVYDETINSNGLILDVSFDNDKNNNIGQNISAVANTTGSAGTRLLQGLYLNGSTYQDLEPNLLQQEDNIRPFLLNQTKTDSPEVTSDGYKMSYNNGRMNGFAASQVTSGQDPKLIMGYYDDSVLSYYWHLASEFVLADNFFAPTMDTGLANYQYLYAANSIEYQKNTSFPGKINLNKTIFDILEAGRHSWKVYVQDYDPDLNYTDNDVSRNRYLNLLTAIPRFVDNKSLNSNIVDLVHYFRDLKGDKFPAVSYIIAPNSDESSPKDVTDGQEFVHSVALALMKSKHWNDSALIITYRESGGWFDHVSPPAVNNSTYGFRVPTLIISPFAKKGYVDDTVYDVTSILRFIEYNYGLQPLSTRDANANNIINAFNFSQFPRQPPVFDSGKSQNSLEVNEKIMEATSSNIRMVNTIYAAVLSAIVSVGLIVLYQLKIDKSKLDASKS